MAVSWFGNNRKSDEPAPAPAAAEAARVGGIAAVMDAANMGFWIYMCDTGALQTSSGLRRIIGKAFPATIASEQLYRWFFSEAEYEQNDLMRLRAKSWRQAMAGEALFDEEHLYERIDGTETWIRTIIHTEVDAKGKPTRLFGMCIDINAQKSREMASAAAGEQIAEESRHKTDFLATMSHEIRTPLNGVLGMTQLLARSELDDRQKSCVRAIRSSGEAMLSMLNNALDLSKIEKGLVELQTGPLDLTELASDVLDSARGHAEEKNLELKLNVAPQCEGQYVGDGNRIRQVLGNLTFNALKFTETGSVGISVAQSPARPVAVRISVTDTGPGIAEAERAKVFERFKQTRSENAHGGGRGSGLGLAICAELAALMGGQIGLDSVVGVGSTFWIDLPLARPGANEGAAEQVEEQPSNPTLDGLNEHETAAIWNAPREDGAAKRILVAEDDPTNQKVFMGALDATGYDIEIANDGIEAIDALKRSRFDIVLMDINMPRLSGDEAIVQIRASDQPYQSVPIVVVTALTSRDARRQYHEMGANDYLPKPIDIDALLTKIDRLITAQEH